MSLFEIMKIPGGFAAGMINQILRSWGPAILHERGKRIGSGRLRQQPRDRIGWAALLCTVMILAVSVATGRVDAASRTVRVGVYQNKPKIFMDANGHASGIYIDLLTEISTKEGWTLVYVPCQWADCLSALEAGQIDLMPDVAYSTDRAQIYDFNQTPVLQSWSQIYANPRLKVNGYMDLTGKRVAVLNGSIQQTVFGQSMNGFGFKVTIVPTDSLENAFQLAGNGSVDAAIANNFFGDYFYQQYGLVKTPIVFNPATLFFATAKGQNAALLDAIDRHLNAWLQEPNSIYYQTLSRWTEQIPAPVFQIPQYVYWVVGVIGGFLILAIGMVLLLRGQVRARTRHLEQTNRALQESENKYRELVENANSIILRWTRDGRITFLNEFGQRFFGFAPEEIIGQPVMGTIVPSTESDGRDLHRLMSEILADPLSFEQNINENVRRNGERVWIAWTNRIVRDGQGQVKEILSIGTDVTERRRAEETLNNREIQLSLILNNVSDIVFAIAVEPDDRFRFTSINRRFLEITGLPEGQIVGALARDVIPEPSHALVFGKYREAIRTGQPAHWEEVSDYPTGRKVGHVTVVPVFDAQGVCTQLVGMVHDITESKRAEDALRISEQKFMKAFHATPDAIVISRVADGLLLDVNEVFLQKTGYTREETKQKTTTDLGLWADPGDRKRYIAAVRAEGRVHEMEARFLAKSGAAFDGLVSGESIEVNGEPCLLTIIRDITERKRTEAELERHRLHLEELVASRTAELAVAKERAEDADRLKSAFLATMSHELRTPLNSIIGFTGIILQELAGPLNAEQRKQLEMVRDSARHLLALINDVLDISKIEAGQLEVKSESFDLRASIEKVSGIVKPLADKKGLPLRLKLSPEVGTFISDPRRVEQIVINLLNNAIKFTERGEVTLTAEMPPGALRISVADTGIGIKPEDLDKLFQPFHQIDSGLTRQHEGTGLGLAICRRLAELLGGEIHAESGWGKGSVFTLLLPMKAEEIS